MGRFQNGKMNSEILYSYVNFLCFINRKNYYKTSKGTKNKNSALQCKEFCEETDGCGAWSFEISTKICTIRENAGYSIDKEIVYYIFTKKKLKKIREDTYIYL